MARRGGRRIAAFAFSGLLAPAPPAAALEISGTFIGGAAPATTGGGTLEGVFEAAAALWEDAIRDELDVAIFYGWAPLAPQFGAWQGNSVEAAGHLASSYIVVSNTSATTWFVDPTPYEDAEFGAFVESVQDLGGADGAMNVGREAPAIAADAIGRYDLLSVMFHEIGHALGFTEAFSAMIAESGDWDVDLTHPLPYAGASIPLYTNGEHHSLIPTTSMNPEFSRSERRLISAADVLAVAQLNGFTRLELDPDRVPEPGAAILAGVALAALTAARRT
jgi:hypothetical protein